MIWSRNPCPCCDGDWWLRLSCLTGDYRNMVRLLEQDYCRPAIVDESSSISKAQWGKSWAFFDLCLSCGTVVS